MCLQVVTQRSAWSDPYHFQVPHTCPPTRKRTWPRQPCTNPTCCRRLAACSLAQVILVAILSLADASPCTCPSLRSAGLRVAPGATRPPALEHIPNLIIPGRPRLRDASSRVQEAATLSWCGGAASGAGHMWSAADHGARSLLPALPRMGPAHWALLWAP